MKATEKKRMIGDDEVVDEMKTAAEAMARGAQQAS